MTLTTTATTDLLQTKEGCIQAATAATENYRECMLMVVEAWVSKGYGSVTELAEAIGKSAGHMRKYAAELRREGRLPPHYNSRSKSEGARASMRATVENEVIEVEVISTEPERDMKPVTVEGFFGTGDTTTNNNTQPNNNVRLHQQSERSGSPTDDDGGVLPPRFNPDSNESIRQLANQLDQESGEPESYLQAARMLREISRLLEYAKQDGWSEAAFGALRDDAESIASSCRASSRNRRERAHQKAEEEWSNKLSPAVRSDRGKRLSGRASSELDTGSLGGGDCDQSA